MRPDTDEEVTEIIDARATVPPMGNVLQGSARTEARRDGVATLRARLGVRGMRPKLVHGGHPRLGSPICARG